MKNTIFVTMNLKIDRNSNIPLYKQIVAEVKRAVKSGTLANGSAMPSLSEFASLNGISMETTKKAYTVLKKEGLLSGHQGKAYFIDVRDNGAPLRVLMLVDKLSAYKLAIHRGLAESLKRTADISINIHNQNIDMFEKMVNDTADSYDYYLVAAHFPKDVKTSRIAKIIRHIPNNKLILIDKDIPEVNGRIGRICQDFANDATNALTEALNLVKKYKSVVTITSSNSLYSKDIYPGIHQLLKKNGVKSKLETAFNSSIMAPGTLFIVLGGQLDNDHFTIIREAIAKGYTLGKDIGLISYNDEPVNEFICNGLSCLSCDFEQMGREAAAMINSGEMRNVHPPFNLIVRASL